MTTGVVTPALATAITATISGQTQKVIDDYASPNTASPTRPRPAGRSASPTTLPAPLLTVKATADTSDEDQTWAAPEGTRLSAASLIQGQHEVERSLMNGEVDGYSKFMTRLGAIKASRMAIDLKMSTKTSQQVRLDRIRLAKTCGDPVDGALLYNPPAGPPERPGEIGFDLDQRVSIAQAVRRSDEGPVFTGKDFFADHLQYFKKNDGYVYRVLVHTREHYCTFRLLLDVTGDDALQTITVDDHGKPFHLTGIYTTKTTYGLRPKFEAYKRLFVTPVGGSRKTDPWSEEDPRTFSLG